MTLTGCVLFCFLLGGLLLPGGHHIDAELSADTNQHNSWAPAILLPQPRE